MENMNDDFTMDNILDEQGVANLFGSSENSDNNDGLDIKQNDNLKPVKTSIEDEEDDNDEITDDNDVVQNQKESNLKKDHKKTIEQEPRVVNTKDIDFEEKFTDTNIGNSNVIYSSIAKALAEDGVFSNLDEAEITKIKNANDFINLINNQVNNRFDAKQQRINAALEANLPIASIQQYENTLNALEHITDDEITNESEVGENLRKQLIYQDLKNQNYSEERIERELKKSFNSGTDIEDAKDALVRAKTYFQEKYDAEIQQKKNDIKLLEEQREQEIAEIREKIFSQDPFFKELPISNKIKQQAFDSLTKSTYKDPDTNEQYTALQEYIKNNKIDFLKNVGILFSLTDGFKSFDKLISANLNKNMQKGVKSLENLLTSTDNRTNGTIRYVSNAVVKEDENNNNKWSFDI